jgi:hypothetical protein
MVAFTPESIRAGFRRTGIWPVDPVALLRKLRPAGANDARHRKCPGAGPRVAGKARGCCFRARSATDGVQEGIPRHIRWPKYVAAGSSQACPRQGERREGKGEQHGGAEGRGIKSYGGGEQREGAARARTQPARQHPRPATPATLADLPDSCHPVAHPATFHCSAAKHRRPRACRESHSGLSGKYLKTSPKTQVSRCLRVRGVVDLN